MKSLLLAGAFVALTSLSAFAGQQISAGAFSGNTGANSSNEFDGGGAGQQYGQHETASSNSNETSYATTGVNRTGSTSYTANNGNGSGDVSGTGVGGFDYTGQGSTGAYSQFGSFTATFTKGW